jgi:hypothetical protein
VPAFARAIGIDYSGAATPTVSQKGLRVYLAESNSPHAEVPPPSSPRKYWIREGIAEWRPAFARQPWPSSSPESFAARTHGGAGRGVGEFWRSRLDPCRQRVP